LNSKIRIGRRSAEVASGLFLMSVVFEL